MIGLLRLVICTVLFVVLTFGNCKCDQIPFLPCEDYRTVTALYINPCNGTKIEKLTACVLMHGVDATIEAAFTAPFNSTSLQIVTLITLDDYEVATPFSGYDPCYGSIVPGCPITKDKPYLFSRIYRIQTEFPVGTTALKLIIRDMQTKEVVACAKVPIFINPNPAYYYED